MVKEMVVTLTLTLTATATATAMVNAMATGTKINQSGFKRHGGGDVFLFLIFTFIFTTMRRMIGPPPPPLLLPSQAVTKGRHASSATAASAQAVAAVGAARCSGLEQSAEAAARRMPSLTPACCVVLVHKLNVCFTWQILPLNDLIPMCVPRNLK
jgi:hypothetical protein